MISSNENKSISLLNFALSRPLKTKSVTGGSHLVLQSILEKIKVYFQSGYMFQLVHHS